MLLCVCIFDLSPSRLCVCVQNRFTLRFLLLCSWVEIILKKKSSTFLTWIVLWFQNVLQWYYCDCTGIEPTRHLEYSYILRLCMRLYVEVVIVCEHWCIQAWWFGTSSTTWYRNIIIFMVCYFHLQCRSTVDHLHK